MSEPTVLIVAHASAAAVALPLGAYQLFRRPRGDHRHRVVGRVWAVLMLWVSLSSFWIRDLRNGQFSFLHILSVITVVSVVLGVLSIRRGNTRAHEANMRGAWFGTLGAFVGAVAVPRRLLPTFAVDHPAGALAALAAVVATYVLVTTLAGLSDPARRETRTPAQGVVPTS